MEELYREGKIRAIGVSNFYPDRLADLAVQNEIVPAVNQIKTHPYWQQIEAQQYLKDNNIQIEPWSPFAQDKDIFNNEFLKGITAKYLRSFAQIILR
jgi:2,5-diketo-D-gluconate reductase A